MIATLKLIFGFLLAACLLAVAAPAQDPGNYRTVYVPPPVGSHLGGGYVRVPIESQGTDESALLGMITKLNAAGGEKRERQFVLEAVSRSTGVSQRELQAQQDILRLRFGDLCAINAIARGNSDKVQQIATLRSKGSTWTQLAKANGVNIATVVQTTRNADQITVTSIFKLGGSRQGGPGQVEKHGRSCAAKRPARRLITGEPQSLPRNVAPPTNSESDSRAGKWSESAKVSATGCPSPRATLPESGRQKSAPAKARLSAIR